MNVKSAKKAGSLMVYEMMQRTGHCRGCDKMLVRGTDKAVKFYSFRNRGQNILICSACVAKMRELIMQDKYDEGSS